MKTLMLTFAALLLMNLSGADYRQLMGEAADAAKKKDHGLALRKYSEAYQAARETADKYQNVLARARYLSSLKKLDVLKKLLEGELRKPEYSPVQKQQMLVRLAAPFLWSSREYQYALDNLNLAMSIDGAAESSVLHYEICYYASVIYFHQKREYAPVITLLEPLTRRSKYSIHLHVIHSMLGSAYAKLGRKQDAVRHYRQAIGHAKKLKKNTSKLEKTVEDLSK